MSHNTTSTEYEKGQTRALSGRGGRGNRGNARNNTRYSTTITKRHYKVEIETFGVVLVLKWEKLELYCWYNI